MESSLVIKLPKPIPPKKSVYDKDPEPEFRTLDISFSGDSEIYSKILKKLEEMANGNGWEIKQLPYQFQITLAEDLAEFVQQYRKEHNMTAQETVRVGLRLLIEKENKKSAQ